MHKRTKIAAIIVFFAFFSASHANAEEVKKGFHTGPYLAIEAGAVQAKFDYNEVDGEKIGRDYEPSIGFIFGWNAWDFLSAELQARYTTNLTHGERREHLADANLFGKWTMILDALTRHETFRILPFLKGGIAVRIAALPGATGASNGTVVSVGVGPSVGGGVSFLLYKYFYFGFDLQCDMHSFGDINQTVNSVPNVLVYKGGFYPSFSGMGMVGVHY